jgi:predicted TIM-barrel fold metal-dependent hydrolase
MFGPADKYPLSPARGYTPPAEANTDAYLAMAEILGLERMVIVHPTAYGADHGCTRDAIETFGRHRARGVAVIDESISEGALRELDRQGFCATRINSITVNGTPLSQLDAIARRIAPFGWHVELYTQPEQWPILEKKLPTLPVPVVIDHMGRVPTSRGTNNPEFQALLRILSSGNCWVKLCGYRSSTQGPPYSDVIDEAQKMIEVAPERCVWGTDWPHPGMSSALLPDDGKLLDLLYDWAPDAKQLHRILVENPAELYGFEG